jgi:succinate dehydrogenase hydrophobic anchor subunit
MSASAGRRSHEQGWLWAAKVATGVAVFALLIIHLIVNHLVAAGGLLSYADVVAYYAHPAIPLMEAVFLVFVVSHALLGVRGIVLDFSPTARTVRVLDRVLVAVGLVAISYGIWLLLTIASRAS